ncbi:MAG: hypothetical protein C0596_06455 [Marinilabiliales bacterium]|nr:MAG: hypothetical protein C0596_06455 [Marinilabiliales bacterium]
MVSGLLSRTVHSCDRTQAKQVEITMKNILIAIVYLIIQSCNMIKLSISEKRSPLHMTVELENNVILKTWGGNKN